MLRMVPGSNGTLIAPKRGKPPPPPPGYKPCPGDPYVFEMIVPECASREYRLCNTCPSTETKKSFCLHFDRFVVPPQCKKCNADPDNYNL